MSLLQDGRPLAPVSSWRGHSARLGAERRSVEISTLGNWRSSRLLTLRQGVSCRLAIRVSRGHEAGFEQATAVSRDFPYLGSFDPDTGEQLRDVRPTGLPQPIILDHRPEGLEMKAQPSQQPKQRRLHYSAYIFDPLSDAHLQSCHYQSENQVLD